MRVIVLIHRKSYHLPLDKEEFFDYRVDVEIFIFVSFVHIDRDIIKI